MSSNLATVTAPTVDNAAAFTILDTNGGRKGCTISNDTDKTIYIKFGAAASSTSYTFALVAGAIYEMAENHVYAGLITGRAAAVATGRLQVTELDD